MLLSINCSVVSSVKVSLIFDDGAKKEDIISIGDLVDIEYNSNGLRKRIYGRVINISVNGTDPNGWYLTVDGSDDFQSATVRFSVMSIIDFTIIKKYDVSTVIETPDDPTGICMMKIVDGFLYYTKDGIHWHEIKTSADKKDKIKPEEGTVPVRPPHPDNHIHHDDDVIEDETGDF